MKRMPSSSSSTTSSRSSASSSRGGGNPSTNQPIQPPSPPPTSPSEPSPAGVNNAAGSAGRSPPPATTTTTTTSTTTRSPPSKHQAPPPPPPPPPATSPLASLSAWLLPLVVLIYESTIVRLRRFVTGGTGKCVSSVDGECVIGGYNEVLRGLLAERRRMLRGIKSSSRRDVVPGASSGVGVGGGGGADDVDHRDDDNPDEDDNVDGGGMEDGNVDENNNLDNHGDVDGDDYDDEEYLRVIASPGLTTLLDDALYRAYEAELSPTVLAASRLLSDLIEMKEASALLLRECRWATGVPLGGGMTLRVIDDGANNDGGGVRGTTTEAVAVGCAVIGDMYVGGGAIVDGDGKPVVNFGNDDEEDGVIVGEGGIDGRSSDESAMADAESMHAEDVANWNEYDTIHDFAMQCYLTSREAITRLTTDRLAETANRTLRDAIIGSSEGDATMAGNNNAAGAGGAVRKNVVGAAAPAPSSSTSSRSSPQSSSQSSSQQQPMSISSLFSSPADAGIGRCYDPQPRRDCWESPRMYCPDYYWAEDAICGIQRMLRALSKHRLLAILSAHGFERYFCGRGGGGTIKSRTTTERRDASNDTRVKSRLWRGERGRPGATTILRPPTYASDSPHVFPSMEAVHSLQYLVMDLLASSIPARLNQFRAATESNTVITKRLYLVKCEYRAPLRALWEGCMNLNAAPRIELVERYLRDYHGANGTKIGEDGSEGIGGDGGVGAAGKISVGSRKKSGSSSTEAAKKTAIQQQREKLEKLITEKYWKHPAFVEALQLERCCEQLEVKMSHMLLPLANLASEIMCEWKGRVRAVTVVNDTDQDSHDDDSSGSSDDHVTVVLGWQSVPYMRELLRRLKSILRRKPDPDESSGIRPLLLDLQGVPRRNQDLTDSSIEMPFYNPQCGNGECTDKWFHLGQFLSEVGTLLELLNIPNLPFLIDERLVGSKGDKTTILNLVEQCNEVWDEEGFEAMYKDWFDMLKRQQELNSGKGWDVPETVDGNAQDTAPTSLPELSRVMREAEIELSIAMASKDQLERVKVRLEALRADKAARYKVLAQIVFDVGYRELNDGILVESLPDDATIEFPKLSVLGVFGEQLTLSGEVLPVG